MATLSTVNVKITGDTGQLVSSLTVAERRVSAFSHQITGLGRQQATGLATLGRGFLTAAGQTGVLSTELSVLSSSVGGIGLATAGAAIGVGVLAAGLGASIKSAIDFESAITRVAKTADFSAAETKAFGDEILEMSRRLPVATSALTDIAVVAGQLGISGTSNIAAFVEEIAKLTSTTGLDPTVLATGLGTLLQVFSLPTDNIGRVSAELTALGNAYNSTEQAILDGSVRLAGIASALNVPISSVLALGNAVAAVMPDIEAGTSAVQRTLLDINAAAAEGGDKLALFAEVAGLTVERFQELGKTRPDLAFAAFVDGLGEIGNARAVLDALELSDVRLTRTLLSLAESQNSVTDQINFGSAAALEATATNEEFGRSSETTAAQLQLFKNNVTALGVEIGTVLMPAFDLWLFGMNVLVADYIPGAISGIGDFIGAIGDLGVAIGNIPPIEKAFGGLSFPDINPFNDAEDAARAAAAGPGSQRAPRVENIPPGAKRIPIFDSLGNEIGERIVDSAGNSLPGNTDLLGINAAINASSGPSGRGDVSIPPGLLPKGSAGSIKAVDTGLQDLAAAFEEFHRATGRGIVDFLALIRVSQDKADLDRRQLSASVGLKTAQIEAIDGAYQLRLGLVQLAEDAVASGRTLEEESAHVFEGIADSLRSAFTGITSKPTREEAQLQLEIDKLSLKADELRARGADDSNVGKKDKKASAQDRELKAIEEAIDRLQAQKKILDSKHKIQEGEITLADQMLQTEKEREFTTQLLTIATEDATEQQKRTTAIASLQAIAQQNYIDALGNASASLGGLSAADPFNAAQKKWINGVARSRGEPEPFPGFVNGVTNFSGGLARVHKDELLVNMAPGTDVIPARGESGVRGGNIAYITINAQGEIGEATARKLVAEARRQLDDEYEFASYSDRRIPLGPYTSR